VLKNKYFSFDFKPISQLNKLFSPELRRDMMKHARDKNQVKVIMVSRLVLPALKQYCFRVMFGSHSKLLMIRHTVNSGNFSKKGLWCRSQIRICGFRR
jgi:hypothetical protein